MTNQIIRALDASLSNLVFTEHMKQTVLRQIREKRIQQAREEQRNRGFRPLLGGLSALTAAIFAFIIVSAVTDHLSQVGDPVNLPPDVGNVNITFQPILTDAPVGPTSDVIPILTEAPTPTAEPTDTPAPEATADFTDAPSAGPILTMSVDQATPAAPEHVTEDIIFIPTDKPTEGPMPTAEPTEAPTPSPSPSPTPTAEPTKAPTPSPSPSPTPTAEPTEVPTPSPTPSPTPTATPTVQPTATPDPAKIICEGDRIVVTLEDNSHDSFVAQEQIRIAVKDATRYVLVTDPSQAPDDGREALLVETLMKRIYRGYQSPRIDYGTNMDMAELTEKYLTEYSLQPGTGLIKSMTFQEDGSLLCTAREDYEFTEYRGSTYYWMNYIHLRSLDDGSMETYAFEQQFASATVPKLTRSLTSSLPMLQLINRSLMYYDGYAYLSIGFRYQDTPVKDAFLRITAIDGIWGDYGQCDLTLTNSMEMERSAAAIRLDGLSENAAVFTVEAVSNTDQQVLFRTDLTVEGMMPPAPTATPTPAPTATPNPKAIVFEDDRIVVTMDKCVNDLFYVSTEMRVALKEPDKYVLVTDPSQALDDPREAILLRPRQECVTYNVTSGLKSFDLADTGGASWRLLNELEQSTYHMTCFDVTMQAQADGSVMLHTVGDAGEMKNLYDETMAILTALTFTDRSGESGRTEVFYRLLPSAVRTSRTVDYRLQSKSTTFGLTAAKLYYLDDYGYLSVKYKRNELTPADSALLTSDVASASGITTQVVHREDSNIRYSLSGPAIETQVYEHLVYRIDGLDSLTDVFYPTLTFFGNGQELFTIHLVSNRVGDVHGPTATPWQQPAATPSLPSMSTSSPAEAASAAASTVDRSEPLSSISLNVSDKPRKYSHYNARLRLYADGTCLTPIFRYHDPLPEGTLLRIVAVDDVPGHFGEEVIGPANLSNVPDDMLSADIFLTTMPDEARSFTIAAIHPDTETEFFQITLQSGTPLKLGWTGESYVDKNGNEYLPFNTPGNLSHVTQGSSFPLQDAIEDGFDLTPDIDYGFFPEIDQGWGWGW